MNHPNREHAGTNMVLVPVTCWERGGATSMTEIAVVVESGEAGAASVGYVDFSSVVCFVCFCWLRILLLTSYVVVVIGEWWLLVLCVLRRDG